MDLPMRGVLPIVAFLFSAAAAAVPQAGIWKACAIDTVSLCTPNGCTARKPTISIFLTDYLDGATERTAYYRCGLQQVGCDRYTPLVYRNGEFVIFSLPDRSVFAKLGPDDRLTDVAALGDTVFVSRGKCVDSAPPSERHLRPR